jgi:hypothetical protein
MRPVRFCRTKPASTSTWMCPNTARNETADGETISETTNQCWSRPSGVARRIGSDKTVKRRSSGAVSALSGAFEACMAITDMGQQLTINL